MNQNQMKQEGRAVAENHHAMRVVSQSVVS